MQYNIKRKMYSTYYVLIAYFSWFILLGFLIDTPTEIFTGLKNILFQSNILITDYIELGGIGAAFINAGTLSLLCLGLLVLVGIKPNGSTITVLFLTFGFGLFGKNLLNVWPIIFGVWLYSKYQNEPFLNYILIALFGTALSPILNELLFTGIFANSYVALIVSLFSSILIGFLLPPVASNCLKMHQGYTLYNIGFAAGLIGTLLMSFLRSFGINFESRLIWYTGSNKLFSIILFTMFISLIILGVIFDRNAFKKLKKLFAQPGRLVSDFYLIFGQGATFVNMGILGIFSTLLVLLLGCDLNGPTIGAIFTIVGFGSFGKHIKNIIPIILGATLCVYFNVWDLTSPGMILGILFSTTLAPIAGSFGLVWGIVAGFLHICIVANVGGLHGGLNLYNNGFAGGLVAIILVPIIVSLKNKFNSSENH